MFRNDNSKLKEADMMIKVAWCKFNYASTDDEIDKAIKEINKVENNKRELISRIYQ